MEFDGLHSGEEMDHVSYIWNRMENSFSKILLSILETSGRNMSRSHFGFAIFPTAFDAGDWLIPFASRMSSLHQPSSQKLKAGSKAAGGLEFLFS